MDRSGQYEPDLFWCTIIQRCIPTVSIDRYSAATNGPIPTSMNGPIPMASTGPVPVYHKGTTELTNLLDICWAHPMVQNVIYIKVRLTMPTGDIMVRLLLRQAYRRPLGYLPIAGCRFWLDYHLSHLADIATTDYYMHRAGEQPHWVFVETGHRDG